MARERAEALTALAALLRQERSDALAQLGRILSAEREALLAEVNASSQRLTPVAAHLAQATNGLHDSLTLLRGWQSDAGGDFDLTRFDGTVTKLVRLTGDVTTLVQALEGALSGGADATATGAQFDRLLHARERRLFGYAPTIAVVFGCFLIGSALILRRRPAP